jgi:hypothetical protein
VGNILRDYSLIEHQQAPLDSQAIHTTPPL